MKNQKHAPTCTCSVCWAHNYCDALKPATGPTNNARNTPKHLEGNTK